MTSTTLKSEKAQADGRPPLAWKIPEWCKESKIGQTKTYQEIAAGRLKSRKVGRHRIILYEDGQEYLRSLPVE